MSGWMDNFEPGPWYSLSRVAKVRRWIRYQPAFKARTFAEWLWLTFLWFAKWRWLPKRDPETNWCNRISDDGDAICPMCMWAITVAQDAAELGRVYRLKVPA